MTDKTIANIAFLGICDRAEHIRRGHPLTWRHNIIGIKSSLLSYIFPFNLKRISLLFAIYDFVNFKKTKKTKIRILDSTDKELMNFNIQYEKPIDSQTDQHIKLQISDKITEWSLFIYQIDIDVFCIKPDTFKIIVDVGENQMPIGCFSVHYAQAPAFTPEYIAAIKSNPLASKSVRILVGCSKCSQELRAYAALERNKKFEDEGIIWFEDLPDRFKCGCQKAGVDLKYIRENLHALLNDQNKSAGVISLSRLYDDEALSNVCHQFKELIDNNPSEGNVQKFIEEYPIILQQFSPEKLFFKKPILASFITDFCILNNKKELLFIEIEKPQTSLMKKDGGIRAEMQHAMDQVRGWLNTAKEERSAVLREIDLKSEEVSNIRGVVILGRDKGYDKEKLRKLKSYNFGDVDFFTYSDILKSLTSLIRNVKKL